MDPETAFQHCSTWNTGHQTSRVLFHVEQFEDRTLLLSVCQALAVGGQSSLVVWLDASDHDASPQDQAQPLRESEIGPMIRSHSPGVDAISDLGVRAGVRWMEDNGASLGSATQGQYDWVFIASSDFSAVNPEASWADSSVVLLPTREGGEHSANTLQVFRAFSPKRTCLVVSVESAEGALSAESYIRLRATYESSLARTIMFIEQQERLGTGAVPAGFMETPESPQVLRSIQLAKELKDHG